MPNSRDHTEWDQDRNRRNPKGTNEAENPFDDPEVQRRISEFIVRAALEIKGRHPEARGAMRWEK